jgi:hypothetical protein
MRNAKVPSPSESLEDVISASAEVNKEIFTVHDQPPSDARWAVISFSDFDDAVASSCRNSKWGNYLKSMHS